MIVAECGIDDGDRWLVHAFTSLDVDGTAMFVRPVASKDATAHGQRRTDVDIDGAARAIVPLVSNVADDLAVDQRRHAVLFDHYSTAVWCWKQVSPVGRRVWVGVGLVSPFSGLVNDRNMAQRELACHPNLKSCPYDRTSDLIGLIAARARTITGASNVHASASSRLRPVDLHLCVLLQVDSPETC
jgi:hypothetical protein